MLDLRRHRARRELVPGDRRHRHRASRGGRDDGATPARVREEVRLATRGLPDVEVGNVNLAAGEGGARGWRRRWRRWRRGAHRCAARRSGGASASLGAGHGRDPPSRERDPGSPWRDTGDRERVDLGTTGQDELHIEPLEAALAAYRLNPEDVPSTLNVVRREGVRMQVGFTLADGRELPLDGAQARRVEFQVFDRSRPCRSRRRKAPCRSARLPREPGCRRRR